MPLLKPLSKPPLREAPGILRAGSAVLGTALFFLALGAGILLYGNSPPASSPEPPKDDKTLRLEDGALYLEVRGGETALSVGKRLKEAGIIRNIYFWRLLSRYQKGSIKTGSYRLEIPMSQTAVYSTLVSGRQILFRVTVPEGVTLKKAARIFAEADICSADDFLAAARDPEILGDYRVPGAAMEGYLYPDTYFFPRPFPAARIVRTMADTFFEKLEKISPGFSSLPPEELNKKVIIASIVEREYQLEDEAALMAGVFYNRLAIGMALQSCATVEYVITEIQGKPHPEILYTRDTEIRDPYNTYIRPGLPPGPISAPGGTALAAAFYPQESDYLYFRLREPAAGRHYFSRTLDDHIRAGTLYVKSRGY
jgi:UPF0755 protein